MDVPVFVEELEPLIDGDDDCVFDARFEFVVESVYVDCGDNVIEVLIVGFGFCVTDTLDVNVSVGVVCGTLLDVVDAVLDFETNEVEVVVGLLVIVNVNNGVCVIVIVIGGVKVVFKEFVIVFDTLDVLVRNGVLVLVNVFFIENVGGILNVDVFVSAIVLLSVGLVVVVLDDCTERVPVVEAVDVFELLDEDVEVFVCNTVSEFLEVKLYVVEDV